MSGNRRNRPTPLVVLPAAALFALVATPLLFLLTHASPTALLGFEWASLAATVEFSVLGALVATAFGGAAGALLGTREFAGRRWLLALSVLPIAAPPAFWWLGAIRLTGSWINASGPVAAAVVSGIALSPVTLLLVHAAIRQLPSNVYESARVALSPAIRFRSILLPLLRSSLFGAFILTTVLLLGESELPFLFGFRTAMTDIVTAFSQTFDVAKTLPLVVPLLAVFLILGSLAVRPVMTVLSPSARSTVGVIRTPMSPGAALLIALPAAYAIGATFAYSSAVSKEWATIWPRVVLSAPTFRASIAESVGTAWCALALTVPAIYPARRTIAVTVFPWLGLLLFCVPAAVYAIGWIGVGQVLGGSVIAPIVAHTSRAMALSALGFGLAYARLPASLEDAAALLPMSPLRRAWVCIVPLMGSSLAACAALIAALTFADRDVASLLLAPGAERLTLNLYLASANAPSAVTSLLAVLVLIGAAITVALAAAGPILLWGRRG